ncbi:TetR/AcrR family transcriptional regulator [Microlunatus soli]|uniref:DNA-binding transcriptional regulator, AcrR family n=1 Tax=Microlunatus soli TaxID=630515 RepID=A0A1H1MSF6_9ACTN|nr:TetR/AcrR family transcriptional regulator [Microlunatus soli]SDR89636.1 DNA-binding transcriptional regulator, AcrR family [Microlunatus soli]
MASNMTRMPREQRRAQLLEAASEVFTANGYHAAAMDDIADAAGVSKPVLYQHFGSKLDLYLALLDLACDRLVDLVDQALASTEDNAQRVVATMTAFYSMVSSERAEFRLIFESDLTGEAAVEERIWRVNNDIADRIATVIADDTGLGPDQSKLLAISLVGIGHVSARYWVTAGRIELAEAQQLVSDLAWRGISGFPLSGQAEHAHHSGQRSEHQTGQNGHAGRNEQETA